MRPLHLLVRAIIISFFLWHAAAIAVSSVPREAVGTVAGTLRQDIYPMFRPYLMATSQWQIWDLFAPDPLRRVSEMIVETRSGDRWQIRHAVRPEQVAWYRRAYELKMLRRIVSDDYGPRVPRRYAELFCNDLQISDGTDLRLTHRYYVLPKTTVPRSQAYWEEYTPKWREKIIAEITCSSPSPREGVRGRGTSYQDQRS